MDELDKLREIFLSSEIDSEDYQDNLKRIQEWETSLRQNEDFASWQTSDVTQSIVMQAKSSYKDNAMRLVIDRKLTETQRQSIWSKQDAIAWLLSLVAKDAKNELKQVQNEIKQALKAV